MVSLKEPINYPIGQKNNSKHVTAKVTLVVTCIFTYIPLFTIGGYKVTLKGSINANLPLVKGSI